MTALLDLVTDADVDVVVCCGAGGVGKTTTAAALALHAAESGRRVVVLTIDPARRLAQALGMDAVGGEAHRVADVAGPGSLDVMMLDMRRTFDEVVLAHATPQMAEQILDNALYESVAGSLAGTQEYMAMEQLGRLHDEVGPSRRWDLVVVDTPPARSALDFLDAPQRLGRFLDGRLVRLLAAPVRLGGRTGLRVVGAGLGLARGVVTALLGSALVGDVQVFLGAMETVLGGFRERAERTYALLASPRSAFVVVTSPEAESLTEMRYFVERLEADGMPLRGVVVNRVVTAAAEPTITAAEEAAHALEVGGDDLAAGVLRVHVSRARQARRHRESLARLRRESSVPVTSVPAMAGDVHDLEGLRQVSRAMARRGTAPGRPLSR